MKGFYPKLPSQHLSSLSLSLQALKYLSANEGSIELLKINKQLTLSQKYASGKLLTFVKTERFFFL
ncbi:hypothetical protein C5745_17075 [Sphingobacterium haloxyli]|uniref:Uncharacterized protein n=1 Tax=Sphingobacterium haloxyli TaxID=2100533 RepID=A0A2S9J019_9SPHI|nr:hypothetical protein C5745_17075 [Sphingobacterium haloxyli]